MKCNREMPSEETHKNCASCRQQARLRRKGHDIKPDYRARLNDAEPPRFRVIPASQNRKLGGIPSTWASSATCPPSCGLKNAGCYAEQGYMRAHWRRTAEEGWPWGLFLRQLGELPRVAGGLLRHWVAGDFPGSGDALDPTIALDLAYACRGLTSFGFTHRVVGPDCAEAARRLGMHLLSSCEDSQKAQAYLSAGLRVALVVPSDMTQRRLRARWKRATICPEQLTDGRVTCAQCRLCVNPKIELIAFRTHGAVSRVLDRQLTRLRLPGVE